MKVLNLVFNNRVQIQRQFRSIGLIIEELDLLY